MGTEVLTRSYDNGRTGANTTETTLTPALVANKGLVRVRSFTIDDDPCIEAQPLYLPNVEMPDGKAHDVLFVASMGNHTWAFDVNGNGIWKTPQLGTPIPLGIRKGRAPLPQSLTTGESTFFGGF